MASDRNCEAIMIQSKVKVIGLGCCECAAGRKIRERTDVSMKKILVYNNQSGIVERMAPLFAGEDMRMVVASGEEELGGFFGDRELQLMLVDVEFQDKAWDQGIALITELRHASTVPLIVVSAQSAETAKVMALEAGADDYVSADCNPLELLARVKSQIRRYTQLINVCANMDRIYRIGGLVVDDVRHTVTVDGRSVRLTPIEYKILRLLVQQRGKVLSNTQIYETIWNMQAFGADNTIAVHVRHIREKIESNPGEPRYLKVVWGNGYKVG